MVNNRKYGLTDPTGEKTAKRRSKKTVEPEEKFNPTEVLENITSGVQTVSNTVQSVVNNVHSATNTTKSVVERLTPKSQLTTTISVDSFQQANGISQKYGIADIQVSDLLGIDPYKADSNIPEMSSSEANGEKLKIQRQNNSLDVRLDKIKQGRKVVGIATEQRKFIGDIVDFETAAIEVGTKVLDNQIAETNYGIRQAKLEQTEYQFDQQLLATVGTDNLTEGIRKEWELKFKRQDARNQSLMLDVERSLKEAEKKRADIDNMLFE